MHLLAWNVIAYKMGCKQMKYWLLKNIQVNKNLKDTYVLSNYAC
jgi:hypothetical protein